MDPWIGVAKKMPESDLLELLFPMLEKCRGHPSGARCLIESFEDEELGSGRIFDGEPGFGHRFGGCRMHGCQRLREGTGPGRIGDGHIAERCTRQGIDQGDRRRCGGLEVLGITSVMARRCGQVKSACGYMES